MIEREIHTQSSDEAYALFGGQDRHLKLIRDALGIQLTAQGEVVRLQGEEKLVQEAAGILDRLLTMIRQGKKIPRDHVEQELRGLSGDSNGGGGRKPSLSLRGVAKSPGQEEYIEAMLKHDLVFSIGPAGSGKTYLAVAMAVRSLKSGEVHKLVLTRPAVEAGERLGFLPGDFQAKINPYLKPLYDALGETLDYDQFKRFMDRDIIEVIPLAYMRGRTLNHSFILLDEAQNTTKEQMKMFLTRMGHASRIVVTGDVTQVDLPKEHQSGLIQVSKFLKGIPGVAWVSLGRGDIVRHPLVKRIVEAYELNEETGSGSVSG